jgi:hypothetical protein
MPASTDVHTALAASAATDPFTLAQRIEKAVAGIARMSKEKNGEN